MRFIFLIIFKKIGNISKYKSVKEIIKLAGLDLVEISSGIKRDKRKATFRL